MLLPKNNNNPGSPSKPVSGSRQSSSASLQISQADILTEEDKAFCERFHLPPEECPIPNTRKCYKELANDIAAEDNLQLLAVRD